MFRVTGLPRPRLTIFLWVGLHLLRIIYSSCFIVCLHFQLSLLKRTATIAKVIGNEHSMSKLGWALGSGNISGIGRRDGLKSTPAQQMTRHPFCLQGNASSDILQEATGVSWGNDWTSSFISHYVTDLSSITDSLVCVTIWVVVIVYGFWQLVAQIDMTFPSPASMDMISVQIALVQLRFQRSNWRRRSLQPVNCKLFSHMTFGVGLLSYYGVNCPGF